MHGLQLIFFVLYVLLGPVTWLLVAYFVSIGRERMNKLVRNRDTLPAEPPLVSILIPAKDEGPVIADCIRDVLSQDYPRFEIIAINDRSTDDTGRVLDEVAANAAAPMRVLHIDGLPTGWLGKCHALSKGVESARGEWVFFVDSDVRLQPEALSKLAAVALARQYDAISILTRIETHTFIERLMLPLLASTWMTVFQGDQTNEESENEKALANGQVFLIRASAYHKVGGHAAVRDRIVEDVELMRLLKKNEFKTRFLTGPHLAATRMHTSLNQMFNGWARIFAGTARGSVWPMVRTIAFLLFCVMSLLPAAIGVALTNHHAYWALAVGVHWLLMTAVLGFVWRWSGNSPAYALLTPVSVPIEIAILCFSIRRAISGKIDWRGSAVDVRQTSRQAD
ncbi:MAG: glycosyltransferase family 2 protein [Tepidisphaeraceae bacterium]